MVIDSHVHLGRRGLFSLDAPVLLEQMKKNRVDVGIVSSVECAEYRHDAHRLFLPEADPLESNRRLLRLCRESGGRLYLSFWCAPAIGNVEGVFEFLRENRDVAVGLKLHPFYSRLPLEDKRYLPYLEIAEQLKLPVSVHTAADSLSSPRQLLSLAKAHPNVDFIMVHMGLGSDNADGIACVAQAENLYGDTTWVPFENVCRAIRVCGAEKILFGSDAPIDGSKSYDYYKKMLRRARLLPLGVWRKVMYQNALIRFKLTKG